MDFESKLYEVKFTNQCIEEMSKIYDYISTELKGNDAAKRLINKVNENVFELSEFPDLYMKIGKVERLRYDYHRIVVKNYVVLYTIDYEKRKVIISHMIYGKNNYLP